MPRAKNPKAEKAEALFYEGMKLIDIAKKLNLPEGTLRSWKNRYKWECNATEKNNATLQKKIKVNKVSKKPIAKEVKSVMENTELTDKQRLFCLYYSKSFNATQSYLKAYECDYVSAMQNGSRMLRNDKVRDEVMRLKELKMEQIAVNEFDLLELHMRIAFADMGDYAEFTDSVLKINNFSQVDTQLIKEVKESNDGISIKLLDRCKSFDWLDKYFMLNPLDKHKIEYENKKLEIEIAKVQEFDEEITESDNFIEALSGKVEDLWQEE